MVRKLLFMAGVGIAAGLASFVLAERAFEGKAQAGGDAVAQAVAQAPYVHTVIFYLKKDAPADAAAGLIKDAHGLLAKVGSVKGVWAGKPADMASPGVAVKDYSVGLLVLFDNYQGLEKYLKDPLHDEYLARNKQHIDKVLVYDFINQK